MIKLNSLIISTENMENYHNFQANNSKECPISLEYWRQITLAWPNKDNSLKINVE